MNIDKIVKILHQSTLRIFTLQDIKRLLGIEPDNTAYKTAENIVKKGFLIRLRKGLYSSTLHSPEDFEIAGHLYSPSYLSLETALNFYGILPQFPYTISSITPRKTRRFEVRGKEFEYAHIQSRLFWGYEKQKKFLIATPEKALIDMIYFISRGWRSMDLDELDYSRLNLKGLRQMAKDIKYVPFSNVWEKLSI